VIGNLTRDKATILHAICAIPNTVFKNKGEIGFFITDSSHFGKVAKREITEEFYEKRSHFKGAYFIDLKTDEFDQKVPFKYKWTRNLTIGDRGEDVLKLQQALQWLGFFPTNVKATGAFFGITRQAVKDFQKKYEKSILWTICLKTPTGFFGKNSITKLESLLSD
jgi:hypothetical protein